MALLSSDPLCACAPCCRRGFSEVSLGCEPRLSTALTWSEADIRAVQRDLERIFLRSNPKLRAADSNRYKSGGSADAHMRGICGFDTRSGPANYQTGIQPVGCTFRCSGLLDIGNQRFKGLVGQV